LRTTVQPRASKPERSARHHTALPTLENGLVPCRPRCFISLIPSPESEAGLSYSGLIHFTPSKKQNQVARHATFLSHAARYCWWVAPNFRPRLSAWTSWTNIASWSAPWWPGTVRSYFPAYSHHCA